MGFIDNLKKNVEDKNHANKKSEFHAVDMKNFYKKEDGSLNKTSIALSIGAVALVLGLGAYSVINFQTKSALMDDVIYGLSDEAAQEAVQEAFLTSINQYLDGDMTADELKQNIAKMLNDYLNSTSAFTDEQKLELQDIIQNYLDSLSIEELIADSQKSIDHVQSQLEKYMQTNNATLEAIKESLKQEIDTNKAYTDEQLKILNNSYEQLSKLELNHYNEVSRILNETYSDLHTTTNNIESNMYSGLSVWEPSADYKINSLVLYYPNGDYENTTDEGVAEDNVELYKNLTGNNTDTSPKNDSANWKKVSLGDTVQNIYNNISGGVSDYDEWLNNHTTDADGNVIDQYVTYNEYIYQNITGEYDPSKTPAEDTTNWQQISLLEAMEKNLQTMLNDLYNNIKSYTEWLNNHEANAGGDVIDQYVTYNNHIYQNITGEYDSSKTPDTDTTNWKEVSMGEAIQNVYNTYLEGMYGDTAGWSADNEYHIDDYVIYKNKIYRNITGEYSSTNPAEDTVNWKEASAFGEINYNYNTFLEKLYAGVEEWVSGASYKPNSYVMYNNVLYRNITGSNTDVTPDKDTINWTPSSIVTVIQNTYNTFLSAIDAKDYAAGDTHSAGDYVVYNNVIYKNVSDNATAMGGQAIPGVTEGDGTDSVWVPVSITEMIDNNYQTFIKTIGAEDYNNDHSYQAGDYVIKNGVLYKANDATSGAFDGSKWEPVTVTDQLDTLAKDLEALELQSSLNMEQLNKNLTDMINENQSLTDEQRQRMLAIINEDRDASADSLAQLKQELIDALGTEATANENERQKLLEQLESLESNTSSYMYDYELRIDRMEQQTQAGSGDMVFGIDPTTGAYGYYVGRTYNETTHQYEGGTFKPW